MPIIIASGALADSLKFWSSDQSVEDGLADLEIATSESKVQQGKLHLQPHWRSEVSHGTARLTFNMH